MAEDPKNQDQNNAKSPTPEPQFKDIPEEKIEPSQHVDLNVIKPETKAPEPKNDPASPSDVGEFERLTSQKPAEKTDSEPAIKPKKVISMPPKKQKAITPTPKPKPESAPKTESNPAPESVPDFAKPEPFDPPQKEETKPAPKSEPEIKPKSEPKSKIEELKKEPETEPTPTSEPIKNIEKPEIKPEPISAPKVEKPKPSPIPIPTPKPEIKKPETPETIVINDKDPNQKMESPMITKAPKITEAGQTKVEARGLSGLLHKIQKSWNKHILENAQKSGKEPASDSQSPAQKINKAAKSSAKRAEEIKQIKEAQKIYENGLATIKDLISPSSMVIEYDHMQFSGVFSQSFFVYTYPRYLETNWLSDIINSDITMDISMFIYPIDSAGILKQLRNKSAQISSSISINSEKGNVRDPQLETALEDVEDLRDRLMRSEEKFFQFGLYFTIYSDDRTELIKTSKQIENTLGGHLIFTKRADMRMEQGFNSSLPQATDELGAVQNMNTGPLSTSFPFISNELSDDHGILYGLNRHNDTLIIFDRFSLENANSVILSTSGAGKSYAAKLEILRSLMLGTDVIVIDPENEYKELSDAVGGTYLNVSMTSDQRINPFDLPKLFAGAEEEPGKALRQNVISLTGLLHLMLGDLTPDESAILDQALLDTYSLKGIMVDTPDPGSKEPPIMSDLFDVLSSMKGGDSLATRLAKFTTGSFGGIFNHQTNVDMGKGMIVFSIRDLEDELRPMAMYVILNFIWNLVRSELRKRLMVVDEAWTMMQYPDSAKFLASLTRRARKYFLGIMTITQNVQDFLNGSEGKTIITNSAMQLLLKQSPAAIDQMTEVFHLTEGEKYTLLNSDKGQGIFFAGLQHVAIQIIASYGEHELITTNPEEILKKQEEKKAEAKIKEAGQ